MKKENSRFNNNFQDRNSTAWKLLCEYIEEVAANGKEEFVPREALGNELFAQIYTLPESISKLKKVTKIGLYGSALKQIPPEIGQMESLRYFDPYTSYGLRWFPYEIMDCKNLIDSRISTRALYGNFKNKKRFPQLDDRLIRYFGDTVNCSICKKEMTYEETNQLWITLRTGTDTIPLLANLCSLECESKLPLPPPNYIPYPHKGGPNPVSENKNYWKKRNAEREENKEIQKNKTAKGHPKLDQRANCSDGKPLRLIKKIWEK